MPSCFHPSFNRFCSSMLHFLVTTLPVLLTTIFVIMRYIIAIHDRQQKMSKGKSRVLITDSFYPLTLYIYN